MKFIIDDAAKQDWEDSEVNKVIALMCGFTPYVCCGRKDKDSPTVFSHGAWNYPAGFSAGGSPATNVPDFMGILRDAIAFSNRSQCGGGMLRFDRSTEPTYDELATDGHIVRNDELILRTNPNTERSEEDPK